jgi:hypothetical protein
MQLDKITEEDIGFIFLFFFTNFSSYFLLFLFFLFHPLASSVHVELPRAIPLLYELDPLSLKPLKLPGEIISYEKIIHPKIVTIFFLNFWILKGSAPYLSGRYLADQHHIDKIMERDHKQVYCLDTKVSKHSHTPVTSTRTCHNFNANPINFNFYHTFFFSFFSFFSFPLKENLELVSPLTGFPFI